MPRKPTRRRRSLIARPLTFAPFSRSLAHLHSTFMPKHQMLGSTVPGSPSHNEGIISLEHRSTLISNVLNYPV
jgi:protein BCP1